MTESDTPQSAEPGELSIDDGAAAFLAMLEPAVEEQEAPVDTEIDPPKKKEPEEAPKEDEAEEEKTEESDDAPITIEVDGKQVTLTKAELADAYKNGLRQSDYTQKTMALAEQRKAAEAEAQKAQQERQTYAQNLSKMAAQLEGAIQQQEKIDWNALLEADPVEFLKQKHLYDQRQVALQKNQQELGELSKRAQAEQAEAHRSHLQRQQDELLAKLPEWKDEAKAKSERTALKEYLTKEGYDPKDIDAISDHKAVLLSRKAMLYDQMMAKAQAAAKKVQNLPQKVERPGTTTTPRDDSGRFAAMQKHQKAGTVDSMVDFFKGIL